MIFPHCTAFVYRQTLKPFQLHVLQNVKRTDTEETPEKMYSVWKGIQREKTLYPYQKTSEQLKILKCIVNMGRILPLYSF